MSVYVGGGGCCHTDNKPCWMFGKSSPPSTSIYSLAATMWIAIRFHLLWWSNSTTSFSFFPSKAPLWCSYLPPVPGGQFQEDTTLRWNGFMKIKVRHLALVHAVCGSCTWCPPQFFLPLSPLIYYLCTPQLTYDHSFHFPWNLPFSIPELLPFFHLHTLSSPYPLHFCPGHLMLKLSLQLPF